MLDASASLGFQHNLIAELYPYIPQLDRYCGLYHKLLPRASCYQLQAGASRRPRRGIAPIAPRRDRRRRCRM